MIAQNFKGDAEELKMRAVVDPLLDLTNTALDQFYLNGFNCDAFLLMLYDANRMPFSQRIGRDAFIQFIKEALVNFPSIGTFESYIFILRAVFGIDSDITFEVTAPGKLSIAVDAYSEVTFDFIGRDLVAGVYSYFDMITFEGDGLVLRGIAGIQSEYELNLLFAEIMPAGIVPTITLDFLTKYFWISEEGAEFFDMTDDSDNQIIFIELGG